MVRVGHVSRTYPFVELGNGHGDQLGLPMALQLEEACLFLDDTSKEEGEQLFVVARLCEVLAEALPNEKEKKESDDDARRGEGSGAHAL